MPEFLPPELEQRLRTTLLRCGPFASDRALRAVFVDARIAAWRDEIPDNTPSRGKRVAFLIDALMEQSAASGENALILFLQVLADRTSPGDACKNQLTQLAAALEGALPATVDSASPGGAQTSGKYNIHIHGGQIGSIGDGTHVEGGVNTYDAQGGMFLGDVKADGDLAGRDMPKTDHGVEPPAARQPSGGDLRKALAQARRTLAKLEEQAAGYTSLTIPVHLANELEDARDQVAELEARHHPEL